MTAIIARLEAATEGSRELDAEIHRIKTCSQHRPIVLEHYPPHYTTSIDAALTLVPMKFYPEMLTWICPASDSRKCRMGVRGPSKARNGWHETVEGVGKTPALALCIAALKARSAP